MESALDKFIRYAKIDTQSDENSTTYPTTKKQFDLLNLLVKELKELGLKDVDIDQYGYVMATVPSNLPSSHKAYGRVPRIGFVSHVDTSPSASGKDVKP
ncbi:MAG: peptidase T, partial [bacterium]